MTRIAVILTVLTPLLLFHGQAKVLLAQLSLEKDIDALVQTAARQEHFSGSIIVTHNGKALISKGYGMANYELDVPNTPRTKFRLGSITKQFTAAAILILRERHTLDLSDPICRYLDGCPKSWQPITIRQLLTHTSGVPDFEPFVTFLSAPSIVTRSAMVDTFRNVPLDFAPGTEWKYSNSGYYLLGLIIERVSGLSYDEFLRREIFEPLGMHDTGSDDTSAVIKNRASGYKWDNGRWLNTYHPNVAIVPFSAGVLYSTVEDMSRWDEALYTDKLLPRVVLTEMFSPLVKIMSEPFASLGLSYGYGWFTGNRVGHVSIEHDGQIIGFSGMIVRFPNEHWTIIILGNNQRADPRKLAIGIASLIFS